MDDQAAGGLSEARRRFPQLVIACLGANRQDKPNGELTARVLFDGTHGISVDTDTRSRVISDIRGPDKSNARKVERRGAHFRNDGRRGRGPPTSAHCRKGTGTCSGARSSKALRSMSTRLEPSE